MNLIKLTKRKHRNSIEHLNKTVKTLFDIFYLFFLITNEKKDEEEKKLRIHIEINHKIRLRHRFNRICKHRKKRKENDYVYNIHLNTKEFISFRLEFVLTRHLLRLFVCDLS